jgi:nicotinamide-nucleotide amidase
MLAEIITIGDEILIGQIVDTNSAWMAQQLNEVGLKIKQITSVSDDEDHILKALDEARERADVIFLTGGLGPTKDDITKKTLCRYFDSKLILNEEALQKVKAIFEKYKRPLLDVNIKQAEVPDNCTVLLNQYGTAPGMWFEKDNKIFISMPGVPFEMKAMMSNTVIPKLKAQVSFPAIIHETIMTAGIGESFLAKEIEEIEDALPSYIKLAYLPKLGQVRLRLSASSTNGEELRAEMLEIKSKLIAKVKQFVIATEDISMEEAILRKLTQRNQTLATAESCTGGYVAHLLTAIPGSSQAYAGGAVSYSYALKEIMLGVKEETLAQHGAVSEETVKEMAQGALDTYQTDYAIACSGIAGPGGGTPDKPVGTVWIAVASRSEMICKRFSFSDQRMQNIERTAVSAFFMLYKMMK